ncbi:hypothetical protein [Nocardioides coralli]|uniref:hypothetical protein n=1 Tax=Nocardioides coralli TaxID=2872154 RepID=UPI001CA3EF76|nr:hypothetical protein [Nocardioides coralli]QZY30377.1 hypothetical protein K6T13_06890 [Nocardioides coralli]
MRLIGLELTRLRWRRAVVVLLGGCVLVGAVILGGTAWDTRPVSASELAAAEELVEQEMGRRYMQRQLAECEERPRRFGVSDAEQCVAAIAPQVDWYVSRQPLQLWVAMRAQGVGLVTVLMGLLMLVGTTFVGADWSSGSMSNQLLFEPRRARIWLSKAGAVLGLALLASTAVLAAFWGGMALLARMRGIDVPPEVPGMIAAASGRAVLLVGAAAVGAYAVTMLSRSTVFTLGAMFAVVVGATVVMALLGVSEAWFPNKNLGAVLWNGTQYYVEPPPSCFDRGRPEPGVDCSGLRDLSLATGARNLGVLLLATCAASLWSFRRRDVP